MDDEETVEQHGSDLRGHLKEENFRLDASIRARSLGLVLLNASKPFFLIGVALAIARFTPVLVAVVVAFTAFLFAQRSLQTMVHDLSHRLFSARNGRRNDALGDLFAAGWIGSRISAYRAVHFEHHRKNGSAEDPEFIDMSVIEARGGLARHIWRYVLGLEVLRLIKKYYGTPATTEPQPDKTSLVRKALNQAKANAHVAIAQLTMVALCVFVAQAWYLYLVWMYLLATWSPLLSGLRFLVEHPGKSDLTVTTPSWFIERALFAPHHFNYHFEHHAWPGLPPYRLQQAHRSLTRSGFFDRHPQYIGTTFVGGLIERTR